MAGPPPLPNRGQKILSYMVNELLPWLKANRVAAGEGLTEEQTHNGKVLGGAPHPFQIIVVSPTTFYVNEGRLHMPGRALIYSNPYFSSTSLSKSTTAVTSVPDYDENGNVYVYLKVYYQVYALTAQWDFYDAEIVATGAIAENEKGSDTITAYYPIGELSLTDGEIDDAPTQRIRSDYTETISGIYLYFEE
jgi:hypothetical protein